MRNAISGIGLALLLCSCSDDMGKFKAELEARVAACCGSAVPPPLPGPVRTAPEVRYEALRSPDPFYPDRR